MATSPTMNNRYEPSPETKKLAAMLAPVGRAPRRVVERRAATFDELGATEADSRTAILQWRAEVHAALLKEPVCEAAIPATEPSSVPLPPCSDEEKERMDSTACRKRLRDQDSSDDEEGPRKQLANASEPEQPEDGETISDCSGPPSPGAASLSGAAPLTGEHSGDTVSPGDHSFSDDGCAVSTTVAVSAAAPPVSLPGAGSEAAVSAAPAANEADEAAMEVSGEALAEVTTPPPPSHLGEPPEEKEAPTCTYITWCSGCLLLPRGLPHTDGHPGHHQNSAPIGASPTGLASSRSGGAAARTTVRRMAIDGRQIPWRRVVTYLGLKIDHHLT
ncbi:hypothetical protein HPB50_011394 [Hyalomma asiaticum]|uniref:Uncharacterized protein n=1 Tax=Hyalomma asiaticum TaxID=266040 RepID=A0ACB7S8S9_HYAAI|nr:hypothetical protein HPB50_011394 [Hyalomma asiaticum]